MSTEDGRGFDLDRRGHMIDEEAERAEKMICELRGIKDGIGREKSVRRKDTGLGYLQTGLATWPARVSRFRRETCNLNI